MLTNILDIFSALDEEQKNLIYNGINKIINPIKYYLLILLITLLLILISIIYISINLNKVINFKSI